MKVSLDSVRRRVLLAAFAALAGVGAPASAADDKACAVVVLHGKWGNPQYIGHFARRLDPCAARSVEMPWSQRRGYDKDYRTALAEIEAQVKEFRAQGYRRVLVAGHSFGANAALAYGAEIGGIDGVIALAPGHSPKHMYDRGIGREQVDEARKRVAAGQGADMLSMEDLNQGKRRSVRMPASVLLSYFDPDGLGHMPGTTARLKPGVPLLWVIGTGDPLYRAGEAYAFASAPAHPHNRYLVVEADHASTPDVALQQVRAWLQSLP